MLYAEQYKTYGKILMGKFFMTILINLPKFGHWMLMD